MDRFIHRFLCCFPGRRKPAATDNQHTPSESEPLLGPSRGKDLERDRGATQGESSHTTEAVTTTEDDTQIPRARDRPVPLYTPEDLAVITNWARKSFIDVKNPAVLADTRQQRGATGGKGKARDRRNVAREVPFAGTASIENGANASIAPSNTGRKVQTLVEDLARGVAFECWAKPPAR